MATLSELQTEVAEEIGSINATDDATKINRELNRGVRDILRKTRCYVTSIDLSLTDGVGDYTLDTSILSIIEAYTSSDSTQYKLERVTPQEILNMRRTDSTSPLRFYALSGANLLMVYPDASSGDTLTAYYVPVPTAMSSAAHDPSNTTYGGIPVDYHDLIARYAMSRLASFDDDQSSAQGARYWEEYMRGIKSMRHELSRKGGNRLAPARVNWRRRGLYRSTDPSQDLGY